MTNGQKQAHLTRVYFNKIGKKDTPAFVFEFKTNEGDIEYNGWLTDKAASYTIGMMKNTLGWNGSDELDAAGDLVLANFNAKRVYELVVVDEEYNGKTYPKVKYVNLPGTNRDKLRPEVVKSEISRLGLKALYHATQNDFAPDPDALF